MPPPWFFFFPLLRLSLVIYPLFQEGQDRQAFCFLVLFPMTPPPCELLLMQNLSPPRVSADEYFATPPSFHPVGIFFPYFSAHGSSFLWQRPKRIPRREHPPTGESIARSFHDVSSPRFNPLLIHKRSSSALLTDSIPPTRSYLIFSPPLQTALYPPLPPNLLTEKPPPLPLICGKK